MPKTKHDTNTFRQRVFESSFNGAVIGGVIATAVRTVDQAMGTNPSRQDSFDYTARQVVSDNNDGTPIDIERQFTIGGPGVGVVRNIGDTIQSGFNGAFLGAISGGVYQIAMEIYNGLNINHGLEGRGRRGTRGRYDGDDNPRTPQPSTYRERDTGQSRRQDRSPERKRDSSIGQSERSKSRGRDRQEETATMVEPG